DAEVDRRIDRFVEFRGRGLFYQPEGVDGGIGLAAVHLAGDRLPALGDIRHYMPSTITPIERALPATMRIAASRSAAFRSGSFCLAISSTCLRVILPTFSVCGRALPDSMPAAFLMSTVVGGVLMMKEKLLSAYAVITTGSGRPGSTFWVCALNALQNSMMFKPRCPSAGPMGGDGFALPAGTWSLIRPTIFFATALLLSGSNGRRSCGVLPVTYAG